MRAPFRRRERNDKEVFVPLAFDDLPQTEWLIRIRMVSSLRMLRWLPAFPIISALSFPSVLHAQDSRRIACAEALQESARVFGEVGDLMDAEADDVEAHGGARVQS